MMESAIPSAASIVRGIFRTAASIVLLTGCHPAIGAESGIAFIGVHADQLTNKHTPTGYSVVLVEFRVKNLGTGRLYAKPPSPERYPVMMELPPGTYCLYSIKPYVNQEFVFCQPPYFRIRPGGLHNLGKWRFGISFVDDTFKLLQSFSEQETTAAQARKRYARLFGVEDQAKQESE